MTPDEIALALALGECSYCPGTANKRFARNMAFLAKNSPEKELSDRQRHYMQQMAWTYRRQLPERFVPLNKPAEMPAKRKAARKAVAKPAKADSVDLFGMS